MDRVSFRLNKATDASVIPCPLHRNFIVPAVNAESTRPIQRNSLTRTASTGVKCTSAQPGSLIVLVTRLFMCDKRFRYGSLRPALELARCSCFRNILFHPIEVLSSSFSLSSLIYLSLSFWRSICTYLTYSMCFSSLLSLLLYPFPFFRVEWNNRPTRIHVAITRLLFKPLLLRQL